MSSRRSVAGVAASTIGRIMPPRAFHFATAASFALRREQRLLFVDELVERGGVAVDAGAWWGPWTFWLSRRCSVVWAFEPSQELAMHLRAVARPNVHVEEVALSDVSGTRTLLVPDGRGSDALARIDDGTAPVPGRRLDVVTRRLDEYSFDRLDFVKIDVEAHEFALLRGARDTLERHRPTILVEIEQRFLDHPIDDVFGYLLGLGYHGWVRRDRGWSSLDTFDVDADQRRFEHDPKDVRYLNNFVFTSEPEPPST